MISQLHTKEKGFTLVETLVAITILLIVIVGPLKISSQTAKSTSFSSEQVTAFFLAQEGSELAQNMRDAEVLGSFLSDPDDGWEDFSTGSEYSNCFSTFSTYGCALEIDTATGRVKASSIGCEANGDNCDLYYSDSGGRQKYTYDSAGNTPTPYNRSVKLEWISSDEVYVRSTVTWRTGSQRNDQEAVVETSLYNVYGN